MKQNQKIFHELSLLQAVIRARLFRLSEDLPLHPHQLPILETVLRFPGITQAEAASRLHVSPASIALSVKRLSASGMIEKQSDPESRRRNRLQVTPLGSSIAAKARQAADEVAADMLHGFSEEELSLISNALYRMLSNLPPESGWDSCPFFQEEDTPVS